MPIKFGTLFYRVLIVRESPMLKQRQLDILKSTILHYISTAEPVGSRALVETDQFKLSSATIRSELKELEGYGYLTHVHTSSGRVPTDLGYRYYVDNLRPSYSLQQSEKLKIKVVFERNFKEVPDPYEAFVVSASQFFPGVSLAITAPRVYKQGLSNMFHLPEFDSIDSVKKVVTGLEESRQVQQVILNFVSPAMINSRVVIGQEIPLISFHDCSLLLKPVHDILNQSGVIAFLGPRRLKYSKCFALLDYFSELVNFFILGGKDD